MNTTVATVLVLNVMAQDARIGMIAFIAFILAVLAVPLYLISGLFGKRVEDSQPQHLEIFDFDSETKE